MAFEKCPVCGAEHHQINSEACQEPKQPQPETGKKTFKTGLPEAGDEIMAEAKSAKFNPLP